MREQKEMEPIMLEEFFEFEDYLQQQNIYCLRLPHCQCSKPSFTEAGGKYEL